MTLDILRILARGASDAEGLVVWRVAELRTAGIEAQVQGRPKHLYSIWKKMQGKALSIDKVFDLRALRIIVADVNACYAALSCVHEVWRPLPDEFSDYIARPKPNGYQSLHTVVVDAQGRPIEIQIRTQAMHEHAESGVAAHWAYKEAGTKGYAGVTAAGEFEEQVAQARKAVLRQLLAWERDYITESGPAFDDRIYVFTPQANVVELCADATAIDFAYALHTDLGHRCRGAKVDGQMVPLNTPLKSGQTVEIVALKEGGPSLDWLNAELGYLQSPRSKAKVRAWFNAQVQTQTIAKGRELVEKLLQREGKTAIKLDDLAARLGFKSADALFEVVGKDEYSLRNLEPNAGRWPWPRAVHSMLIDYLHRATTPLEIWWSDDVKSSEHLWAAHCNALSGAAIPLPRFGASDCDCNAHLFFFDAPPDFATFEQRALPPSGQRRRIFRATDLTAAIPDVLQRRTGAFMEQPT